MNILVTGGAGYVGSIVSNRLIREGYKITIIDNLQSGHTGAVPGAAKYYMESLDRPLLLRVLVSQKIELVVHAAASMSPSLSIIDPRDYFQNNLIGSITLVNAMLDCGVRDIIFSSSGCVYGTPQTVPVFEKDPKVPTTPYGETKLMFEQILEWYSHAYKLNYIAFRYHNVAGATSELGSDKPENNGLVYSILDAAAGKTEHVPIFGTDYPTWDGTCVRDYVHVKDIAHAYLLAIERIDASICGAYNLGSGQGSTVLDVINCARKITGRQIPTKAEDRRPGDPPALVADITKARDVLSWQPQLSDLETIIGDSWHWILGHPGGYR